jgi:hypothetical protein
MYAVEADFFTYGVYGHKCELLGYVRTHSLSYAKVVADRHWGINGYSFIQISKVAS